MKMNILKSKKIIFALALGVAIMVTSTVGTLAYLKSNSGTVVNTFTVGSVETEIDENVDPSQYLKKVRVVNTGKNDCLVRMRVVISPENSGIAIDNYNDSEFEKKDDGFWYYKGILKAPTENEYYATPYLFTNYKIPAEFKDNFTITVYQEAVQAMVHLADGTKISAYGEDGKYNANNAAKIWQAYDAGQVTK